MRYDLDGKLAVYLAAVLGLAFLILLVMIFWM
jgi:hypothetical protein